MITKSLQKIFFIIWFLGLLSGCRLPFLLRPSAMKAQNVTPQYLGNLSDSLKESSGLAMQTVNTFWSQNDGGNTAALFLSDTSGAIRRRVAVAASNVDWEEIALTSTGDLLIGDFGNNTHNRQDLKILRIQNFLNQSNNILSADVMPFRYEDQTTFPPPNNERYFDAEAMLVWSDSIYVLTKDFDNQPYTGISRIYRLPTTPSVWGVPQIAKLVHVLPTDPSWKYYGAVTGAAKSGDGSKVALLTYSRIFLYINFQGKKFWQVSPRILQFGSLLQREAVTFRDDCTLLITCENSPLGAAKLYSLNLCDLLTKNDELEKIKLSQIRAVPTPSVGDVNLLFDKPLSENGRLQIYDLEGKIVWHTPLSKGDEKVLLSQEIFENASKKSYIWQIVAGAQTWVGKILRK